MAAGILVLVGGCTSAAARRAAVNDRVACSTHAAAGRPMAGVRPVSVPVPGQPTARRPALAGAVPAGLFPRDLAYDPATGQVLLANFNSGTIEAFPKPKP